MKKTRKLTQKEIHRTLDREWEDTIKSCFGVTPDEARKKFGLYDSNTETPIRGLKLATVFALGGYGKHLAKKYKIRTQQDLQKAVEKMRNVRQKMPSATRKAFKIIASTLPRAGGPGRQPKLNRQEASKVCDQIGVFIRQGCHLKEALLKTADLCPTMLGKKVGPRTLQKAWDRRKKTTSE
jgi:hypothetical protein